jgi:hypothetical protein
MASHDGRVALDHLLACRGSARRRLLDPRPDDPFEER